MKSTAALSIQHQIKAKSERRFLFGLLLGLTILFSVFGSYECNINALKHPASHRLGQDSTTFYEPKEVDEIRLEEDDSSDSSSSSSHESAANIYNTDKRSRKLNLAFEKVLRHIEDDKPKRIDRMKYFGALGKRGSISDMDIFIPRPAERLISKKSKQAIDRMRFMGNIGK